MYPPLLYFRKISGNPSTNEELSIELSSANYDKPDESIIFQEVSIIDISENDSYWFIC